jgi:hypothetical protein
MRRFDPGNEELLIRVWREEVHIVADVHALAGEHEASEVRAHALALSFVPGRSSWPDPLHLVVFAALLLLRHLPRFRHESVTWQSMHGSKRSSCHGIHAHTRFQALLTPVPFCTHISRCTEASLSRVQSQVHVSRKLRGLS